MNNDDNDEFTKVMSENLNLTLQNDFLSRSNLVLKQKIVDKDIEIGNLKVEKLKLVEHIKKLNNQIISIKENYAEKTALSETSAGLIQFLTFLRKKSESEVERETFGKYIELLTKNVI